jgi:hypothetical protein
MHTAKKDMKNRTFFLTICITPSHVSHNDTLKSDITEISNSYEIIVILTVLLNRNLMISAFSL